MNKKEIGEYYTPVNLVCSMVEYVKKQISNMDILEPSAGDGRFVKPLLKYNLKSLDCIELFERKCEEIRKISDNRNLNVICNDFIDFSLNSSKKYDLIIGNPPYIKKRNMNREIIDNSSKLLKKLKVDKIKIENIWVSFILSSVKLLKPNGSIFFILPFEFLQVNYSEELRLYLEEKFNKIEIIVFDNKVFDNIEQDVCLLYLTNDNNYNKEYIKYSVVKNGNDINKCIYESKIMKNKPLKKWTNSIITDKETELLKNKSELFKKVKDYGYISPGIVTGNNDFFIKNKEFIGITEAPYIPVISKSILIGNKLIFNKKDFEYISKDGKAVYLLILNQKEAKYSKGLQNYLKEGEKKEYNNTYKCKTHKPWYNVPIIEKGDLLFFKRFNLLPRLIINEADVYTTDISYNIRLDNIYDKYSFGFCFYNSLTLAMTEYLGRFYGGGVCEMIPNEFKDLPMPYKKVSKKKVNELNIMIKRGCSIHEITNFVDNEVLKEYFSQEELLIVQEIRKKLIGRRIK